MQGLSKLTRFVIFCIIFFLAGWGIYPSLAFYFNTGEQIKEKIDVSEKELKKLPADIQQEINIAKKNRNMAIAFGLDLQGGISLILEVDYAKLAEISERKLEDIAEDEKDSHVERIIKRIRNRIDAFGTSEIIIRKQSNSRILIQIPGETNAERVINIITKTGKLEFIVVDNEATQRFTQGSSSEKELESKNQKVLYEYTTDEEGNKKQGQAFVLDYNKKLDGDIIKSSSQGYDEYSRIMVGFTLTTSGTPEFAKLTSENVGKNLAIVLDNEVLSAPTLQTAITGGSGSITGTYTVEEAKDLALILQSGSLSAPIKIISKDVIAATMGERLRKEGLNALFSGIVVVIIFMILWYRFFGVVAVVGLVLNAFLVIAFLAQSLTLSLASIAGLLLTIGMSIDANVIIFERIKEECRNGSTLVDAVNLGYSKAFWSIFDANVTTILAAFVLYYYGGGVQGFATTLFIGIVMSMITSLFITRFVFDVLIDWKIIRKKNFITL